MKKLYLILMMLAAGFAATAQSDTISNPEEQIYTIVKKKPQFHGGTENLYQWLAANIKYPEQAKEKGIEGLVFVTFIIEKDGSVSNVQVIKSPADELSEEAIRVVQSMPKWKPGYNRVKCRKKPVRVQYALPINFKL